MQKIIMLLIGSTLLSGIASAAENSIGMTLVKIPAGTFVMGTPYATDGMASDADESPARKVTISKPFLMAAMEVTNRQFELYDPAHKRVRGKRKLSTGPDDAAVFVSWHDAEGFCRWLSKKEGKPYRLPTEAEWEYACRAGTGTPYSTGKNLPETHHKAQSDKWHPASVSLKVGATPKNPWGLHDMHGNVEEWCHDWYGPYPGDAQSDPVGPAVGIFKVTRGGSHNTHVRFLRSANRLGTLPEDKSWLIGFRVVQAPMPEGKPAPPPARPAVMGNVDQKKIDWTTGPDPSKPFFTIPIPFVREPFKADATPFHPHNHCPSLTWCENGDLLAVWYSTRTEKGREMTILASRLRRGKTAWDRASEFFKAPDRNMTGSSLFHDGKGTLFFANGLEAGGCWANLALVLRKSKDNGATWSKPWFGNPEHQPRNQVISGMAVTQEGWLLQPCDAVYGGSGGSAIHISCDEGQTWFDPGAGSKKPNFQGDEPGGTIAGIHAGVQQLSDGSLLAFGRGDSRLGDDMNVGQRMPKSISKDLGKSWRYSASPFPPINGGQRLVLLRLREGPLLFLSFTDSSRLKEKKGMLFENAYGGEYRGYGLFAALSMNEGLTWPVRKLITDGQARRLDGGAWTRAFTMDRTHAEPKGYLAATQTPDGRIHLISSRLYYCFNLSWLKTPAAVATGGRKQ